MRYRSGCRAVGRRRRRRRRRRRHACRRGDGQRQGERREVRGSSIYGRTS